MNYKKIQVRFFSGLLMLGLTLGGSITAMSAEEGYAPLGIHVGSFYIFPVVEIGIGYDDNVFRLPDENASATGSGLLEPRSDTAVIGRAAVTANSDWNRHALNGLASVDLGRYSEFDSEDFGNYNLEGSGRLDIQRGISATGVIGFRQTNEDRNSVDSREVDLTSSVPIVYGAEPTTYTQNYVGAGFEYSPRKLSVLGDLEYQVLDYDDNENIFGGNIDNGDRDRARTEARLRFGYEIMPQRTLYVEGAVNGVDYDRTLDNNGIERSSTGYKASAGMSFDLSNVLVGDIYVGYLEQDYDNDALADISSNLYGAGLIWFPSQLTSVDLRLDRNVEESTEATVSGYLSTTASVGINHELKRNIFVSAGVDVTDNEYQQNVAGQKENETIVGFDLEGRYLISRMLYTSLRYRHEERESDIKLQEYTNNRALLTLGVNW